MRTFGITLLALHLLGPDLCAFGRRNVSVQTPGANVQVQTGLLGRTRVHVQAAGVVPVVGAQASFGYSYGMVPVQQQAFFQQPVPIVQQQFVPQASYYQQVPMQTFVQPQQAVPVPTYTPSCGVQAQAGVFRAPTTGGYCR